MQYIYKQKFSLRNQPFINLYGATALFVEPDNESCALYSRHMKDVHMNVIQCGTIEDMAGQIMQHMPDVLIVNPSHSPDRILSIVQLIKQQFPQLPVITISETIRDNYLDAIMQAGVSLHINRQFTQPRDLLIALEQTLS